MRATGGEERRQIENVRTNLPDVVEAALDAGQVAAVELERGVRASPLRRSIPVARHRPIGTFHSGRRAGGGEAVREDLVDDRAGMPRGRPRARVEDEVVRTGNVMRVRADAVDPPIPGIAAVEQPAVADDRARGRELCTPPRFAVRLGIDDCGRGARLAVDDVAQPYPPRRALGRPKTDDRRVADLRRTLGHVQL